MRQASRFLVGLAVVLILLGLAAWYYLFGPNETAGASLVPADTVFYAAIPNGMSLAAGYETSSLKKLIEAPEARPLLDQVTERIGSRNVALLQEFSPNLSGQSFIAVTHFDAAQPAQIGLIAALKPKAGFGNFDGFVTHLRAAYPHFFVQGTSGKGQVDGLDYQWIQGPGASGKICVAQTHGWIVTTWGEAPLLDWWQRFQKKGGGPSLSENADYQKSQQRAGAGAEARVYIQTQALLAPLVQKMGAGLPKRADYFAKKFADFGLFSSGTSFENGEITDHFSLMNAGANRPEGGAAGFPCEFDTLKFTSPDTRLYFAESVDFPKLWQNWQEQAVVAPTSGPGAFTWLSGLQAWAQGHNLDLRRNILDALGHEVSLQVEWSADNSYPDVGAMVKVDKPDDFKPTIAAILDTLRQRFALTAVVNEINSDGHDFATLKFVRNLPVSPTLTEDGPYFGIFLTENHAVRAFKRDLSVGLANNPDFMRQIGDRRKGASALAFVDSPQLLDRAYQTALPYVPLAAMFNTAVAKIVQGGKLPSNLGWLAPMGTWAYIVTPDAGGFKASSSSGIGNQGIFLGGFLGVGFAFLAPHLPHPMAQPVPTPLHPDIPPQAAGPSAPADSATANAAGNPVSPVPPTTTNMVSPTDVLLAPTPPAPSTNAAPSAPAPQ